MTNELYSVRSTPQGWRMVKWDKWYNVLAVYELHRRPRHVACECFAANKHTCRHREMLTQFIEHKRVDKGWFYEHGSNKWVSPIRLTWR